MCSRRHQKALWWVVWHHRPQKEQDHLEVPGGEGWWVQIQILNLFWKDYALEQHAFCVSKCWYIPRSEWSWFVGDLLPLEEDPSQLALFDHQSHNQGHQAHQVYFWCALWDSDDPDLQALWSALGGWSQGWRSVDLRGEKCGNFEVEPSTRDWEGLHLFWWYIEGIL